MYPRLFNDLVRDLGLGAELVPEILKIYSTVSAPIALNPGAESLLVKLRQNGLKLGLVTNGSVLTQRNKVNLLGLEKHFDAIVYAREAGKGKEKPDPESYRIILEELCVPPFKSICVGDNPHTDFIGARQLGMTTIRLLSGEFKEVKLSRDYEADILVHTLDEIRV
jgi:putative hydrolase of the HAD superfamily